MSKAPAQQPPWNIYEACLMLEVYLKCKDKPHKEQVPYLEKLSKNLRQIAINRGLNIDERYRNLNGMVMQFQSMRKAFSKEGKFDATKRFVEACKLYINDKAKFYLTLSEAYLMIENKFDFSKLDSINSEYNLFTFNDYEKDTNEDAKIDFDYIIKNLF